VSKLRSPKSKGVFRGLLCFQSFGGVGPCKATIMSETFEQHAAFIILITHDAKVSELWRTPRNGVDPNKLDIAAVKAVRSKYFPETKHENFAPLYRDKATLLVPMRA
jgi:hypothetical protein